MWRQSILLLNFIPHERHQNECSLYWINVFINSTFYVTWIILYEKDLLLFPAKALKQYSNIFSSCFHSYGLLRQFCLKLGIFWIKLRILLLLICLPSYDYLRHKKNTICFDKRLRFSTAEIITFSQAVLTAFYLIRQRDMRQTVDYWRDN